MRINTLIKLGLETRAKTLRGQEKTFDEIAAILSEETKETVTTAAVFRYFKGNDLATAQVIETKDNLKAKVVEVEISTIEDRQKIISGLLSLASGALEDRDRVAAYKVATEAIDSLDKRIGKLTNNSCVTINNINAMKLSDLSTADLLRMIDVTDR
jgi:hypothetical protein